MASQLLGIKTRFTNDLGSPLVGGQVYTFFAGTSTAQDTYSDAALTVPNTNPVILDDTGSADIFLKGSYRIRVFDKSGRFIEEQDNVTQASSQGDTTELSNKVSAVESDLVTTNTELNKVKLDTGITATAKFGGVERTQAQVNAETVSLLDFGAPYETDSSQHLQNALDYLNSRGGGSLHIPFYNGTLKLQGRVTLHPDITVLCDDGLVIDCSEFSSTQFRAEGSYEDEIPISSSVTSGANRIKTASDHNLEEGDVFLLISQRECAHPDAGDEWILGGTTANTTSPFFAEPLTVSKVISSVEVETRESVIFPDYNPNNSSESSPTARASATIKKLNLLNNFKWIGGNFIKNSGTMFYLDYTKYCYIKASFNYTGGSGQAVRNSHSLCTNIDIECKRPVELNMVSDHSHYNTIVDVASWYSRIKLVDNNGIQGIDQSYSNYCALYPTYDVTHYNSHEVGATFHGNCYGGRIKVVSYNSRYASLYNRARGVIADVTAFNCGRGIHAQDWGMVDCDYKIHGLSLKEYGINFRTVSRVKQAPVLKNTRISGRIHMSLSENGIAVVIAELADEDGTSTNSTSGLTIENMKINTPHRAIDAGGRIHNIVINNVDIVTKGSVAPIWFRNGSSGHYLSNIRVNFTNTDNSNAAFIGGSTSEDLASFRQNNYIDLDTIRVKGGAAVSDTLMNTSINSITLKGTESTVDYFTINNSNLVRNYFVTVEGASGHSKNRIVLQNDIPLNYEINLFLNKGVEGAAIGLYGDNTGIVYKEFSEGILDGTNNQRSMLLDRDRVVKIRRVNETEFIVY